MNERKRIFLLISIMALVGLVVAGVSITMLYRAAFNEQRARLVETAESRARIIEAIAGYNLDDPGGPGPATISQITEAHKNFAGFGDTGEFTLARRQGDQILFLLSHRHGDLANPQPVSLDSGLAEPMRAALDGQSGSMIGLDYRGERVLAAYEPVAVLDLGIVAKIDIAEVRAPFVRAALTACVAGFFLILIGSVLFLRISDPIIRRLRQYSERLEDLVGERTMKLAETNETLKQEVDERKRSEGSLRERVKSVFGS